MAIRRVKVKVRGSFGERAQRFAVELPVKYRESGAANWRRGATLNMSTSGVLFRAEEPLPPRTRIEMELTLPAALPDSPRAEIKVRGTVVRRSLQAEGNAAPVLGASIQSYRLGRPRQARM